MDSDFNLSGRGGRKSGVVLGRMYRQLVGNYSTNGGVRRSTNDLRIPQSREHAAALHITRQRSSESRTNAMIREHSDRETNLESIQTNDVNQETNITPEIKPVLKTQVEVSTEKLYESNNEDDERKSSCYTLGGEDIEEVIKACEEQTKRKRVTFHPDETLVQVFEFCRNSERSDSIDSDGFYEILTDLNIANSHNNEHGQMGDGYNKPVCVVSPTIVAPFHPKDIVRKGALSPSERSKSPTTKRVPLTRARRRINKPWETKPAANEKPEKSSVSISVNVNVELQVVGGQRSNKPYRRLSAGKTRPNLKNEKDKPVATETHPRRNFIKFNITRDFAPYHLRKRFLKRSTKDAAKEKSNVTANNATSKHTSILPTRPSASRPVRKQISLHVNAPRGKYTKVVAPVVEESSQVEVDEDELEPTEENEEHTPYVVKTSPLMYSNQTLTPSNVTQVKRYIFPDSDSRPRAYSESKVETTTQLVRIDTKTLDLYKQRLLGWNMANGKAPGTGTNTPSISPMF